MNAAATVDVFNQLILYHQVLHAAPGRAMHRFLHAAAADDSVQDSYLHLVRTLFTAEPCPGPMPDAWQNHLLQRILIDENPLTTSAAAGRITPETLEAAAFDLRLLQRLFTLTSDACRSLVAGSTLPRWPGHVEQATGNPASPALQKMAAELAAASDWGDIAPKLAEYHRLAGAGLVGNYWYLRWEAEGLQGVAKPDVVDIDKLVGLAEPKAMVLRNTEQFLHGSAANNLLLYGSRGTGKSTMVRGLAMRYGAKGLRLVEIARAAMPSLPQLFRALKGYPQRFVLFLDDLSFDEDDSDFKAFKSVMEGALEQRPANVLLYATSNRRHLVPERWTDRNAPEVAEVHGQDALEEKLSLADRFGMTVLFPTPSQVEYLAIVQSLARERGLAISQEELTESALRWVLWHNPRSGRAARQFVDDLEGRLAAAQR